MAILNVSDSVDALGNWTSESPSQWLVCHQPLRFFWSKRALDILGSIVLLVFFAPILLVVAICIAIDTRGPVIFVQERVGSRRVFRNGHHYWEVKIFRIYKFRSMAADTDPTEHQQHIQAYIAGEVDPDDEDTRLKGAMRVTRVGRIIRITSLDELPQLVNVLKGDMSLIGPRPVPTYEVEEYQPHHYERLAALPGITGLWQVKGRCDTTFEEQMAFDVEYARTQSLWIDIKILLLTIPAVLSGRGAA